MADVPKIFPLGDGAVTIDFGNEISISLNDRALGLASYLDANRFPGYIESAHAYASVGVFYDFATVRREFPEFPTAFEAVRSLIESALDQSTESPPAETRSIEIPTSFDDDAGPDLEKVANFSGLSPAEVIDLFLSRTYRVFMIGFLPGFAYMGDVDAKIAMPRRSTPRNSVARGSVGIAGRQTGIYPLESPGGWQIIGRTNLDMFTPAAEDPCLLRPGDNVRFVRA